MTGIVDVAKYICMYYKEISKQDIDELKLQKLLYFCQREKLAIINEPLFEENMKGWKHGPVSTKVRRLFKRGELLGENTNLSDEDSYIIRNVVQLYGEYDSWQLAELSHKIGRAHV